MGVLAYSLPNIDLIMDIAGGVFGIPMIFLFPALIGIKKWVFKNQIGHIGLCIWLLFWILFTIFTIYKIIMD